MLRPLDKFVPLHLTKEERTQARRVWRKMAAARSPEEACQHLMESPDSVQQAIMRAVAERILDGRLRTERNPFDGPLAPEHQEATL